MKFALIPIVVLALISASTADDQQNVGRPEENQHHHHHHHNPTPAFPNMDQNQPGPTTPKRETTTQRMTTPPAMLFLGSSTSPSVTTTTAPGFLDRFVGTIKGIEATIGGGIEHKFNSFFEIIGSIVRWIYNAFANIGTGIQNGINWKGESIERLLLNLFQKGHSIFESIAEPMDFLGTIWNMLAPLSVSN